MNKFSLVLFTVFATVVFQAAFSSTAHAQDAKRDIRGLLSDIDYALDSTTASSTDLMRVRDQLNRALAILQNGSSTNPGRANELTCVSRDDDGHEPYNLAVRDPRDFSTIKIPGAVLSQNDCGSSIQTAKYVSGLMLFCASADSDAHDPYSVFSYDAVAKQALKVKKVGSMSDCTTSLSAALVSPVAIAFCASRDNDGHSPFVRVAFDTQTKTVRQVGDVFQSLAQCNSTP